MLETLILSEPWDVDHRLVELGMTRPGLTSVAMKAAVAIRSAVGNDPASAPGLLGWIFGTRALREELNIRQDWHPDRTNNVEAVLNSRTGVKVIYQNVDAACRSEPPKPRSGKGDGSAAIVQSQLPFIFEIKTKEDILRTRSLRNCGVWFLCVSVNGDDIFAELSRPLAIYDGDFKNFQERIFICNGDKKLLHDDCDQLPKDEIEVVVTKK